MYGLVDLVKLAGEELVEDEMAAMPRVARFQTIPSSSSAMERLKPWRESVFHGTEDLTAVFEGLRVRDFEFDGEFGDGHFFSGQVFSADENEIDRHADSDSGEDEAEDDGVARDSAWLPGARAELVDELDVTEDGAKGDEDAECYKADSRPAGEAGVLGSGDVSLGGSKLSEEEAEAADGEANTHEAEAGANPGEEGALGGEVDSGVLFRGLVR